MKQKTLLSILFLFMIVPVIAQKQIKGFAITASQKGNSGWKEVRIVDMTTGEELQSIYKNDQTIELLNARTGKPVVKKDPDKANPTYAATVTTTDANGNIRTVRKAVGVNTSTDLPFATNSAACAYDKKHERLYYTPMGINELRYIDLKSKTPRIYYFENEAFGALSGPRDIANQVTRMVIGADGNGYALTNNANHLIRFTTGKKPTITNLGAINDDASNGDNSIHHQKAYGGDMVAHKNGNLYLLTANRRIFRIDIEKRIATFVGEIRGLPKGFTTNGAMVNEGMNIIVCSSNSTQGYFQFDLDRLEAEKITGSSPVYNASDLANSNLLTNKKKKKEPVKYDELNPVQDEIKISGVSAANSQDNTINKEKPVQAHSVTGTGTVKKKERLSVDAFIDSVRMVLAQQEAERKRNPVVIYTSPPRKKVESRSSLDAEDSVSTPLDARSLTRLVDMKGRSIFSENGRNLEAVEVVIQNNSPQVLKTVSVDVFYYKKGEKLIDKSTLYFKDISPGNSYTLSMPANKKAASARFRLAKVF